MGFYGLILGTLAVWRVTHLLAAEAGPWEVLARFRRTLGEGFWGKLLDCFYCLSLWISLPFAFVLASGWRERGLTWLALSAGAILLERATARTPAPPVQYYEDPIRQEDTNHELLRTIPGTGAGTAEPVPPAEAGTEARADEPASPAPRPPL
jgi:hypothetical protein